jgi:hypothetical protein
MWTQPNKPLYDLSITLKIYFRYVGKEIYCTVGMLNTLFSTKCHLFNNFIFFCSSKFLINNAQNFKYQQSFIG